MPKATLEFSLPDEEWAHWQALLGAAYHGVLADFLEELRRRRKHGDHPEAVRAILEELWTWLWQELNDTGLGTEFA